MGKCPPFVLQEGANVHHYTFVEGANVLPCQSLGGQMSSYTIFHRGVDVRGGKCPAPGMVIQQPIVLGRSSGNRWSILYFVLFDVLTFRSFVVSM